jgi:hypothetical protein
VSMSIQVGDAAEITDALEGIEHLLVLQGEDTLDLPPLLLRLLLRLEEELAAATPRMSD